MKRRFLCGPVVLLMGSLLIRAGSCAEAQNLLANAPWRLYQPAEGDAAFVTEPAQGLPEGNQSVLRITVKTPSDPFYKLGIRANLASAVPADMRLRLRFWARSQSGNPLRAVVEQSGPPYAGVLEISPLLTPEWKQYTAAGISAGYGANGLAVRFQCGHQAGDVQLTGITLEKIGLDPEIATAKVAVVPAAVNARIRKYRTGALKVVVLDRHGKAVPGASVAVAQTRHAFLFGCNLFNLEPGNTEEWQKAYQERFAALFNYATLPFYWGAFEPEPGKPQYERLDAMARWCQAHGLTPKGHPLLWHEVYPEWAPRTPDEAVPLMHQRVTDLITHYRGVITYWDVLNEATSAAGYRNGEGAWIRRDGPASVAQTALTWAREAGRDAHDTFLINDFNTGESSVALLTELQQRDALPDAIGIQSHMHGGTWPLERVWTRADRFAKFGKPVHFTEVTVLSGPRRDNVDRNHPPTDWVTTPIEEARQADYLARFYAVLFSHPAVRAITYWDFSDRGAWQNAPAGLLRDDMSPKPAYDRLLQLIRRRWWTNRKGRTSTAGSFVTPAYYGDYRISVSTFDGRAATQTVTLPTGSGQQTVTVRLP
jgi:GH35 family endo-1,4-beta-xylanase